jgi:hypothetical protein
MLSIPCLQGALALSLSMGLPAQPSPLAATLASPAPVEHSFAVDGARVRAEFDKALAKHVKAVEKADSIKVRTKLEAKHPARKYWRKFSAEARKGDGPSVTWMLEYVELAGFDAKKVNEERGKAIELLTSKFSGADWIASSLEVVHADSESIGATVMRPLYEAVVANNADRSNQAMALYRLAWMDKRAGNKEESERRFEDLAQNYRKTQFGTTAASTRTSKKEVDAGASAPDFYAETLEGHAVSLSDYKGKVVLLDFYGFW